MPKKRKSKKQIDKEKAAAKATAKAADKAAAKAAADKAAVRLGNIETVRGIRIVGDFVETKKGLTLRSTTDGLITTKEKGGRKELRIETIPQEMSPENIALILLRQIIGDDPEQPNPFPPKIIFGAEMENPKDIMDKVLETAADFYPDQDVRYRDSDESEEASGNEFSFDESAISYLADFLGLEIETLGALQGEDGPEGLNDLDELRSADVIGSEDTYAGEIAGHERALEAQGKSMPGGGRTNTKWALGSTRNTAKRIVETYNNQRVGDRGMADLFPKGSYSIHHKVSRSRLRKLHVEMKSSGARSRTLESLVEGMASNLGTESSLKAMLNMPANLEVGPSTDRITGDEGAKFDGNPASGRARAYTARSERLSEVDALIDREDKTAADWNRIAQLLKAADDASRGQISAPDPGLWQSDAESGKFKKKRLL